MVPSIRFNTQLTNESPLEPRRSHNWTSFGMQFDEVVCITAVASHIQGPSQSDLLQVEDILIETTRDDKSDPAREVHFKVTNRGASTIDSYVINVAFLSP